jgi:FMN phosphatase YigB (HAD superfamily)
VAPLRAALIDVGGTLWPDGWIPPSEAEESARIEILRTELQLSNEAAVLLVDDLRRRAAEAVPAEALAAGLIQQTDNVTRSALDAARVTSPDAAGVVRRAMGQFFVNQTQMFDGAPELLRAIHGAGLRTVIVSNTFWRDAAAYVKIDDLGFKIDGAVTSLDTGFRKPHASMFDAALSIAGCEATECVFIGNVEELDIEPAAERGMRTIRVCIEDPVPERSRADAVVTFLADAASVLRRWTRREP